MVASTSQSLKMSDAEFRMFCELLRERSGLHFDDETRFLVEKRLSRRVHALELGSFAAYHYHLRSGLEGDQEFSYVIDELTTNETYFFRERRQLEALVCEILPSMLDQRRAEGSSRPVNIWSAGCSSGEEPYSIVMMSMERGMIPGTDLHVYASDISGNMLRKSRAGIYREASFRETEAHMRERYFSEKDGLFSTRDDIKQHVDLTQLNLLDRSKIALLGAMDVILCRNVIIYFDLDTKKEVIQTFHDKLRPGGYLLLGHSESLINVTSAFELSHLQRDLVYHRPGVGEEAADPWDRLAIEAVEESDANGGIS